MTDFNLSINLKLNRLEGVGPAVASIKGLDKGIKETDKNTKKLNKSTKSLTTGLTNFTGKSLMALYAINRIAAGLGNLGGAFLENNRLLREANTLFPDFTKSTREALGANSVAVAQRYNRSIGEVREGLIAAGSAGVEYAESFGFIDSATRFATGSFAGIESAVTLGALALNAFERDVSELDSIFNSLTIAVDDGIFTVDQLANVFDRAAPPAVAMGISMEEIAATLAILTQNGFKASRASVGLARLIDSLSKPGHEAAIAFERLSGKAFKDFIEAAGPGGLAKTIGILANGAEELDLSFNELFTTTDVRAKRALISLADDTSDVTNMLDRMATDTENLDRRVEEALGGAQGAFADFTTDVGVLKDRIGEFLVEGFAGFVLGWNELKEEMQRAQTENLIGPSGPFSILENEIKKARTELELLQGVLANLEIPDFETKFKNKGDVWRSLIGDLSNRGYAEGWRTEEKKDMSAALFSALSNISIDDIRENYVTSFHSLFRDLGLDVGKGMRRAISDSLESVWTLVTQDEEWQKLPEHIRTELENTPIGELPGAFRQAILDRLENEAQEAQERILITNRAQAYVGRVKQSVSAAIVTALNYGFEGPFPQFGGGQTVPQFGKGPLGGVASLAGNIRRTPSAFTGQGYQFGVDGWGWTPIPEKETGGGVRDTYLSPFDQFLQTYRPTFDDKNRLTGLGSIQELANRQQFMPGYQGRFGTDLSSEGQTVIEGLANLGIALEDAPSDILEYISTVEKLNAAEQERLKNIEYDERLQSAKDLIRLLPEYEAAFGEAGEGLTGEALSIAREFAALGVPLEEMPPQMRELLELYDEQADSEREKLALEKEQKEAVREYTNIVRELVSYSENYAYSLKQVVDNMGFNASQYDAFGQRITTTGSQQLSEDMRRREQEFGLMTNRVNSAWGDWANLKTSFDDPNYQGNRQQDVESFWQARGQNVLGVSGIKSVSAFKHAWDTIEKTYRENRAEMGRVISAAQAHEGVMDIYGTQDFEHQLSQTVGRGLDESKEDFAKRRIRELGARKSILEGRLPYALRTPDKSDERQLRLEINRLASSITDYQRELNIKVNDRSLGEDDVVDGVVDINLGFNRADCQS